ncbi:MAG: deoxyribonuclease IV [Candidatus Cloacimonadota bacterium]|nr:MAG: deoxyribonuclease IV [Candidatus Cloacimonadota bacterium]PIE78784.1 MAG: deoxyribonuclease IV [Candidatus Delongbacteria bacterium]
MKYLGAHISISGGVENAPLNAQRIGSTAFAMFTKNQRRWVSKPYTKENISKFKENLHKTGIRPDMVLVHDGYLINLGHPEEEKRIKSLNAFIDEARRTEQLGLSLLNFHPGSHLKQISEEECIKRVAKSMNEALRETENVKLVIETTAGQGSNLGYKFEHLSELISLSNNPERVGVCIDTCHIFAAGYDIRTYDTFNNTMEEFDTKIGFDKLMGMHINDAKSELGSRVDRHHSLGLGNIGEDCFRFLINDDRFDDIPLVMETIDESIWEREIKMLRSFNNKI